MRLLGVLGLCGALCACEKPPFPKDFLWGASTAGFQVDMGCPTLSAAECEDEQSDWYAFITRRSELSTSVQALMSTDLPRHGPGHWELYETDFQALQDMGLNGYRMSLEWSRIFPTATDGATDFEALRALADPAALARYHQMFASLKARKITPLVTLNHYSLPLWIHDAIGCHQDLAGCSPRGWLDRARTVREIAKYAGFVAREFGGEVDLWATENEPFAVVLPGFLLPGKDRVNPPGVSVQYQAARDVMMALIEAHARMYDAVKAADTADADGDGKAAQVGLVYAMVPFRPKNASNRLDQKAAENLFYLYNTAFLDGVCKGDVDPELDGVQAHRDDLAGRMDWLGINYYSRATVEGLATPSFPDLSPLATFNALTLEPWEDYPRGLYEMALHVQERYGLPSYVTETGASDPLDDGTGASWLARYATWAKRAVRDGADLRGFFYWSLMDNFEWNHGMALRFGLYAVDKDDPAKTRVPRQAVGVYREIAKANDVPRAVAERYPAPEQ